MPLEQWQEHFTIEKTDDQNGNLKVVKHGNRNDSFTSFIYILKAMKFMIIVGSNI